MGSDCTRLSAAGDTIRVLQITDTHLKADVGGTLLGMDTDHSLQAVIELVKNEYDTPDVLLVTGDLADSGARGAYRRAIDYFDALTAEHYWLPGNHDRREAMLEIGGPQRLPGEICIGAWQLVLLDSQLPGEVGGHLGRAELERLETCLQAAAKERLYSLVCLHHHPVPVGCAWLDEQVVSDARAFFEVLARFPLVRGVLWGHVHQELDRRLGDLRLLCTPSTCVQFLPGQTDFAVDTRPPGYRWLELGRAGSLATGVSRAEAKRFYVDREASGYI